MWNPRNSSHGLSSCFRVQLWDCKEPPGMFRREMRRCPERMARLALTSAFRSSTAVSSAPGDLKRNRELRRQKREYKTSNFKFKGMYESLGSMRKMLLTG